jgi:flagellar motor component MotA
MAFYFFFGAGRQNIGQQIQSVMATLVEFRAALAKITAATDNISADLVRLADQIKQGGISSVEEDELLATLNAAAEKLNAVADLNPEPETPVEPA